MSHSSAWKHDISETPYCVSAADLDKAYSVIDEAADMLALVDP